MGNTKPVILKNVNMLCQNAISSMQKGDLAKSKKLIKAILKKDPGSADANYLLGIVATQEAKFVLACKYFQLAIKCNNQEALYYYNYGVALSNIEQMDKAKTAYTRAIKLKPDFIEAYNNLGIIFFTRGEPGKALSIYDRILQLRPDSPTTHCNRGNALKELGKAEEAIEAYHKAIELEPDNASTHYNLGILLENLGRPGDALHAYENSIKYNPSLAEAHCNHGVVLVSLGYPKKAASSYRRALELRPDYKKAHSNLLFSLNYQTELTQAELFTEHCNWNKIHGHKNIKLSPPRNKAIDKRLRIGYVSPDLRNHSVAFFFLPLLCEHNKNDFEIYCYSNTAQEDDVTEKIKSKTDHWRSIINTTDHEVVTQIQRDDIDILIDLTGHTSGNRLGIFAYKPAPIQVTWLGYPNTTGLTTIDYRITDNIADPSGHSDQLYSEKLIRIDTGFVCYQPPDTAPEVAGAPCLDNNYITFGSFNEMAKINSEVISVWIEILHKTPESRLLLKNNGLGDENNRERLLAIFEQHDINRERIMLHGRLKRQRDHLDLYRKVDICLDTFPYNGTTTTCEALWMGVPVVTLSGKQHASRVSASILTQLNFNEWITTTASSYIKTSVKLAHNKQNLARTRACMREEMLASTLLDARSFAAAMENLYRIFWRNYIQQ